MQRIFINCAIANHIVGKKISWRIGYSGIIFVQIDQHLKKLLQKYKGVPIFTARRCASHGVIWITRVVHVIIIIIIYYYYYFFIIIIKSPDGTHREKTEQSVLLFYELFLACDEVARNFHFP